MAALRADLRESPSLLPALAAVVVFTWLAADQAGYEKATWYPAGLILLALLAISLVALPRPRPSRATWIAVALLGAYAVWSYVSITWAGQKDVAWDGANRTLVYVVVLALFALWPLRPRAAALVLGSGALAVAGRRARHAAARKRRRLAVPVLLRGSARGASGIRERERRVVVCGLLAVRRAGGSP